MMVASFVCLTLVHLQISCLLTLCCYVSVSSHLSNNNITEIPTGYLAGQTALEELYLDNNKLEYLEDGVFEDLGVLKVL